MHVPYEISPIPLWKTYWDPGLLAGTGDPWVERTTWMLAKFTHSYVAVVQGADLLMKANLQDRTVQLGSHSSSSGGIVPCGEGLMVYHLETQNDARLFRQVSNIFYFTCWFWGIEYSLLDESAIRIRPNKTFSCLSLVRSYLLTGLG